MGGGLEKDSIALPPSLFFLSDRRSYNFHQEKTKHLLGKIKPALQHELSLKFVFMKIFFITQGDLPHNVSQRFVT